MYSSTFAALTAAHFPSQHMGSINAAPRITLTRQAQAQTLPKRYSLTPLSHRSTIVSRPSQPITPAAGLSSSSARADRR